MQYRLKVEVEYNINQVYRKNSTAQVQYEQLMQYIEENTGLYNRELFYKLDIEQYVYKVDAILLLDVERVVKLTEINNRIQANRNTIQKDTIYRVEDTYYIPTKYILDKVKQHNSPRLLTIIANNLLYIGWIQATIAQPLE